MARWSTRDIPDLAGRLAIVTGANSGLGYETSLALAGAGAHVILACRNPDKGGAALARIQATHPNAQVELGELDLASLASIRRFADHVCAEHRALDILCNNAGIMAIPRRETEDGLEMQIGTNHLGHFALTGLLLQPLLEADAARVVNVSSLAHVVGKMRFEDLQSERSYQRWLAYAQSKLANLLFTFELQRRLEAAGKRCQALAAHPGYSSTNLQLAAPKMEDSSVMGSFWKLANGAAAQSAQMGALPTLRAATDPEARGGDYFGPGGLMEAHGYPKKVKAKKNAHDPSAQQRLFEVSEQLTHVTYAL